MHFVSNPIRTQSTCKCFQFFGAYINHECIAHFQFRRFVWFDVLATFISNIQRDNFFRCDLEFLCHSHLWWKIGISRKYEKKNCFDSLEIYLAQSTFGSNLFHRKWAPRLMSTTPYSSHTIFFFFWNYRFFIQLEKVKIYLLIA